MVNGEPSVDRAVVQPERRIDGTIGLERRAGARREFVLPHFGNELLDPRETSEDRRSAFGDSWTYTHDVIVDLGDEGMTRLCEEPRIRLHSDVFRRAPDNPNRRAATN